MKIKEASFGISMTVNLGNYESQNFRADTTWEFENPEEYGKEIMENLPKIKAGLVRLLEELSDKKTEAKLGRLSAEIKETWNSLP